MIRYIYGFSLVVALLTHVMTAEVVKDVEFGEVAEKRLLLDYCIPAGDGPFPVAILVHGGGWGSGDKARDIDGLFEPLTKAGIAWYSINYRHAPEHPWPACFDDVRLAVLWVREHAADHGCAADRIALVGYSAGGQLATLAAIRAEKPVQALVGLAPAVDLVADSKRREVVSPSLQNLLGLPETLDDQALEKIATISPAEEIVPGLPPFLLVQGTADQSVRHVDTVAFAERLRKAEVQVDLIEMKEAPHRITDWAKFSPDYAERVAAWLKERL